MRKIWVTTFFALFIFLIFYNSVKAEVTAKQLIEGYLHDKSPEAICTDCISHFYFKIAEKGGEAVQPLLEALNNQDSLYVEHHLDFIYLLGMIGDTGAYSALRIIFFENKHKEDNDEGNKWRLAISIGACLGEENIDDFVTLAVRDTTGGALQALREMSGKDFGKNEKQWAEYLKAASHLEAFRASCRRRSAPILG